MVQRSFSFLALAGLLSCSGDPTGDLRNGTDHLTADPTSLFVRQDSSKFVTITAVDEQGNTVAAKFSDATNLGAGITVVKDPTFAPVFNSKGELVQPPEVVSTRYIVTGTVSTASVSFTVNAGGKSITIPVRVLPAATTGLVTMSTAAPAAGDTVTLTLPADYRFTPGSVVTVVGTALFKAGLSADSAQLKVVGPPGLNGAPSVTGVVLRYAPAAASFTATSATPLVTPALPLVTLNKTNAVAGDTIVVTLPARYRFTPGATGSTATVGTAGLAVVGVSADSSQLRFLIGPSANDTVKVTQVRIRGAGTLGPFSPNSGASKLVTPAVPNFTSTFASATPAIQDTVTLTAGAGFKFLPTATISTGANAIIVSRAADSSSIRFVPIPGTTSGPVTVTGVVLSFLRTVSLTLPSSTSLTVPAAYAGATAVATAPTINIPAAGATSMYLDNGPTAAAAACSNAGNHCRFYQIVLAAPRTFKVTLNWGNTADIGGYFVDAAGADQFGDFACDQKGSGAAGQPESCTQTLPAGTFFLALADFTAAAQNTSFQIVILGQ